MRYHDFTVEISEVDGRAISSAHSNLAGSVQDVGSSVNLSDLNRELRVLGQKTAPLSEQYAAGSLLGEALLPGEVRRMLKKLLEDIDPQDAVRISIVASGDTVERIPWEYAHALDLDGDMKVGPYLALHNQLSLVRKVSYVQATESAPNVGMIKAILAPATQIPGYDRLQVSEVPLVLGILTNGGWQPTSLVDPVSRESLLSGVALPHDVFHFVGHGGPNGGLLVSATNDGSYRIGEAESVGVSELGSALVASGVKLVVLNACRTGSGFGPSASAARLIEMGIPAVVAMQYDIEDSHAIAFSRAFYLSLMRQEGIDTAVARGRWAMNTGVLSEWGVPVLYMAGEPPLLGCREPSDIASIRVIPRKRIRYRIPQLKAGFAGREKELAALGSKKLVHQRGMKIQVITGTAGIGKSQLAAAYAHDRLELFDIVAWIRAAEDGGRRDLAGLAEQLGLATVGLTPTLLASRVGDYLEATDLTWLLILDNIDGPQSLVDLPTFGTGEILATSRSRGGYASVGTEFALDVLSHEDAVEFLCTETGRMSELTDAGVLVELLSALPLALRHAAGVCRAPLGLTLSEYAELVREMRSTVLFDQSGLDPFEETVSLTWQPSIEQANLRESLAGSVLGAASFLAPDSISPVLILDGHTDISHRRALSNALQVLSQFSLIEVDGSNIRMHRLLQKVVRDAMPDAEAKAALTSAFQSVDRQRPTTVTDPSDWHHWESLVPHVRSLAHHATVVSVEDPQGLIELVTISADYLVGSGAPKAAVEMAELGVWLSTKFLNDQHRLACLARASRGEANLLAGRFDDAILEFEALYVHRDDLMAVSSEMPFRVATGLSQAYETARRSRDAIELMASEISKAELTLGRDHNWYRTGVRSLATSQLSVGNAREAVRLLEELLKEEAKLVDLTSRDRIETLSQMAAAFRASGRPAQARILGQRAAQEAENRLGSMHPVTLNARFDLGSTYRCCGDLERGISLEERVVADRSEVLGSRHTDTLWAKGNLGLTLLAVGRNEEAILLARQVASDRMEMGGEHDAKTLTAIANLAIALRSAGSVDESIGLLRDVASARSRVLGSDHFSTLSALNHLGLSLRRRGDFFASVRLFEDVIRDRSRLFGESHPATLSSMCELGSALRDTGQFTQALRIHRDVLIASETSMGFDHPETLWARRELAATLADCGQWSEAVKESEGALARTLLVLGDSHPYTKWVREVHRAIRVHESCRDVNSRFGCERILWE